MAARETKGKGAEGQMLRCVLLLPLLQSVQRFGPAPDVIVTAHPCSEDQAFRTCCLQYHDAFRSVLWK